MFSVLIGSYLKGLRLVPSALAPAAMVRHRLLQSAGRTGTLHHERHDKGHKRTSRSIARILRSRR